MTSNTCCLVFPTYPAWKIRPGGDSLTQVSEDADDDHTGLQPIRASLESNTKPPESTLEILKRPLGKKVKYHCSMEAQIKINIIAFKIVFNELPFTAIFYARVSI